MVSDWKFRQLWARCPDSNPQIHELPPHRRIDLHFRLGHPGSTACERAQENRHDG